MRPPGWPRPSPVRPIRRFRSSAATIRRYCANSACCGRERPARPLPGTRFRDVCARRTSCCCRTVSSTLRPRRDEFRTIFPTKTIEYLISGRPILAHSPADAFLTKFLVENDCALVVDRPDVDAFARRSSGCGATPPCGAGSCGTALQTARQFQAANVAAEFRKWVNA